MKPLTIEELKKLEVGDWVWVVEKEGAYPTHDFRGEYCRKVPPYLDGFCYGWHGNGGYYKYEDYGKKWLAYKNKEQAEAKSEIVELPCEEFIPMYFIAFGRNCRPEIIRSHHWEWKHYALICGDDIVNYNTQNGQLFEYGVDMFSTLDEAERRIKELEVE